MRAIAIGLAALLFGGAAFAQGRTKMGPDEKEIIDREMQFMAAWNKGDAKAAMAWIAEDSIRVGAFGDIAHGRKEIEAAYQKLFSGPMKGAQAKYEPSVKLYAADVAVAEGPLTIQPADGSAALQGYVVEIWKKKDGHWWLAEGHPKLYPPRPAK